MTAPHPTPFPYEDADHRLPPHSRPPVRRPHDDPYGDAATRITISAWLALAVTGLMGAIADHDHAGYWISGAFLGCMAVSIAAITGAAALRAVKP